MFLARDGLGSALKALVFCGALLVMLPAQAHLMTAQKGTLNIVGQAAFLVLSLPASALQGVDDDGDGALSPSEMTTHAPAIREQVSHGVSLRGPQGPFPLTLMMVDRSPPENEPQAPASHLVVLGRFQFDSGGQATALPERSNAKDLSMGFTLFGKRGNEQQQDVTITQGAQSQWVRFSSDHTSQSLFPSAMAVLIETARLGATHVMNGPDHLLFLLIVLSSLAGWRAWLGALTCFTVGHALTLVACIWGGWSASARWVEPAIAATIIGMAVLDAWSRRRGKVVPLPMHLGLIFLCSLIHGLGLAGALRDLTQWPAGSSQLVWALAGFNLGIEAAQIAVAAFAGLLVFLLTHLLKALNPQRVGQLASVTGVLAGGYWFLDRVVLAF